MKKKTLTFFLALALNLTQLSQAKANEFLDFFYTPQQETCFSIPDDLLKYNIETTENIFKATFQTQEEYIDILKKRYGCDKLKAESNQNLLEENEDGIMYMIWRTKKRIDNVPPSFFQKLPFTASQDPHTQIYSSIEDAINSKEYRYAIKKSGEDNVFFHAIDIKNNQNLGLYNKEKLKIK